MRDIHRQKRQQQDPLGINGSRRSRFTVVTSEPLPPTDT